MTKEYYIVCALRNEIYVRGAGNRSRSERRLVDCGRYTAYRSPLSGYHSVRGAFEARDKMLSAWPLSFVIEVDWDEEETVGREIDEQGGYTRGLIR